MVFPVIIGALTTAASTIMTAVRTIGPAVSSFAASVGPVLANVIQTLKPMAAMLSKFANTFLQAMSILKPGETIEALGERALQAVMQGIKLDQTTDFAEYIEKLREIKLDPELDQGRSPAKNCWRVSVLSPLAWRINSMLIVAASMASGSCRWSTRNTLHLSVCKA